MQLLKQKIPQYELAISDVTEHRTSSNTMVLRSLVVQGLGVGSIL